jgi:hypothetical protein
LHDGALPAPAVVVISLHFSMSRFCRGLWLCVLEDIIEEFSQIVFEQHRAC